MTPSLDNPLQVIPFVTRPGKPRQTGLTMIEDWGIGPQHQEDILRVGAQYVDQAKIVLGIGGLLSGELLREKLSIYRAHGAECFIGGQFLEMSVVMGKWREYLGACKTEGFGTVEVSDNQIPLEPELKRTIIRTAVEEFGLQVFGETGKKVEHSAVGDMIADIRLCLEAGSALVMVEAKEIFGEGLKWEIIRAIAEAVPVDKLIFETPSPWIAGVTEAVQTELWIRLLEAFGPEVNIGNVEPDAIFKLETLRVGVGVDSERVSHGTFYKAKKQAGLL